MRRVESAYWPLLRHRRSRSSTYHAPKRASGFASSYRTTATGLRCASLALNRYFDNVVNTIVSTDATLECREATGSPGRLVGTILPVGRVAGDQARDIHWERYHNSEQRDRAVARASVVDRCPARLNRFVATMANCEWTSFLPDTESGRALAASVRSGETPGLSVEFHALDEARVSGVREIRQSLVTAVAVVPSGSYDQSRAEVRSKAQRVAWWLTMSWWRRQPEVRGESSFTETRLLEQFTRAISGNVRHGALGGLQCAASAIARAFAAAEVEGDDGLLDATTLYSNGIRFGPGGSVPLATRRQHRAAQAVSRVDR